VATPEPALRLFNISSRDEVSPPGEGGGAGAFATLIDDRFLWTGARHFDVRGASTSLRRWDLANPAAEPIITRDPSHAEASWAYSPAAHLIASPTMVNGANGPQIVIKLLDALTGEEKRRLTPGQWISSLTFAPDGKTIASAVWTRRDGKQQSSILLLDAATGAERGSIAERLEQIFALAYTPDGKAILALGRDGRLRIWEVDGLRERNLAAPAGGPSMVRCMAVSPDGRLVALGGELGANQQSIRLIDPANGQARSSVTGKIAITALAFRPDSKALAVANADGNVTLADVTAEKTIKQWQLPGPVHSLLFSSDGRYLLTGNGNGTVYILRLDNAAVAAR
jgi:WD40 repeat protein